MLFATGLSGFVGSHIMKVIPERYDYKHNDFDIRDKKALLKFIKNIKPTRVLHLAGIAFVPYAKAHPQETLDVNFLGTLNLLEVLEEIGFSGTFVYVSTGDVYGNAQGLLTEETLPKPSNIYAVSKLSAEHLCYLWSKKDQFKVCIARPFNHIGVGQKDCYVVQSFAKQVAQIMLRQISPEIITGNLNVQRDFLDVGDVISAYQTLFEKGINGEVYNICSGSSMLISDILEKLIEKSHCKITTKTSKILFRNNEQISIQGSNLKLASLGWKPLIPIENTLEQILAYWHESLKR